MSRKWTREQALAICDNKGTLLLSAAAGSGKTAVLVERVVRLLSKKSRPIRADRLLIVTFTNEAAHEMKQRIDARISELLQEQPDNLLLQQQQILLQKADICTISAFCMKIAQENFQELDLPAGFGVADDAVLAELKKTAIEEVMEQQYRENSEVFGNLIEFLCDRDDSRLIEVVYKIYEFIRSLPFEFRWLEEHLEQYRQERCVLETDWGKTISAYCRDVLEYVKDIMERAVFLMREDEKIRQAYEAGYLSAIQQFDDFLRMLDNGDWDTFYYSLRDFKMPRIGALRGYQEDSLKNKVAGMRDAAGKRIKSLTERLAGTEKEFFEDLTLLYPQMKTLFDTVKRFHEKYAALKKEQGITDFPDIEHFALQLLVKETSYGFVKTPLAEKLTEEYDRLLIDEYQDTNEVQDMIFAAISRNQTNMFMVGDVKQSIYRFRLAMPEIFLEKRSRFHSYDKRTYPATIILDKNFRSRKQVTDTVNYLFSQLMSEETGDISYTAEEELIPGADYIPSEDAQAELHIVDMDGEKHPDGNMLCEARYVAHLISDMLDKGYQVQDKYGMRPCRPGDFCILLRSQKGKTSVYAEQLALLDIRSWADTSGNFLTSAEVSVIISLLRVIDNPLNDIPLLAAMLSPLFSFSPDDLARIRLEQPNMSLYLAVVRQAESGDHRCAGFLDKLEEYRQLAAVMQVNKLVEFILDDTNYMSIIQVMRDPSQKKSNIRLFCDYAVYYSKIGYLGLSAFIRFIDRMIEKGEDLKSASKSSDGENAVRIMSVHGSKGLEFPICIVADCGKQFNKQDLYKNGMLNARLGFAMKVREHKRLKEYTNIPYEAVRLENERQLVSEEMRVLYVALTRAREKLIMTMTSDHLKNELQTLAMGVGKDKKLPYYAVRTANSFGQWILMALLRNPDMSKLRYIADEQSEHLLPCSSQVKLVVTSPYEAAVQQITAAEQFCAKTDPALYQRIVEQVGYVYPFEQAAQLPSKLSVTQIAASKSGYGKVSLSSPRFLRKEKMTGADRGTAVHTFLQFADFDHCIADLPGELDRMEKLRFLSPEQKAAVDIKKLQSFFSSNICRKIMSSNHAYREYKFMYEIPAGELYPEIDSKESILLQGIADCVIEEDDGLIIVDYKTDHSSDATALAAHYAPQLVLYRRAIEDQFRKKVKSTIIYAVELGQEIEV